MSQRLQIKKICKHPYDSVSVTGNTIKFCDNPFSPEKYFGKLKSGFKRKKITTKLP